MQGNDVHSIVMHASCVLYTQHTPIPPQDFLDWYFKFDRMMLPLEYNTVPEQGATHKETLGGNPLKIIHFTRNKPFFRDPSVPLHSLLTCAKVCWVG